MKCLAALYSEATVQQEPPCPCSTAHIMGIQHDSALLLSVNGSLKMLKYLTPKKRWKEIFKNDTGILRILFLKIQLIYLKYWILF